MELLHQFTGCYLAMQTHCEILLKALAYESYIRVKRFKHLRRYSDSFLSRSSKTLSGGIEVHYDYDYYYDYLTSYGARGSLVVKTLYCILASCYIRLTLNICSFVRQCNTWRRVFYN
jgi:hypothetical protein